MFLNSKQYQKPVVGHQIQYTRLPATEIYKGVQHEVTIVTQSEKPKEKYYREGTYNKCRM